MSKDACEPSCWPWGPAPAHRAQEEAYAVLKHILEDHMRLLVMSPLEYVFVSQEYLVC